MSGLVFVMTMAVGCDGQPSGQPGSAASRVVPYVALDREFSEALLEEIGARENLDIQAKYDVESTKTVGLTNAIVLEADNPRCDLFWNNEIVNTLRLKKRGLLAEYRPKGAEAIPDAFKDPEGTWHGFAARARVLIVNTDLVPEDQRPDSIEDLADPAWKGRIGLAKPLFGTTASHAACLFVVWGDDKAKDYFRRLKANEVQILAGNKTVARAVADGQLAFGMTDTDDAIIEQRDGKPVAIVYPDRQPNQLGTLFIPNTIAVLQNAPHPEAARALADALLTAEVEARLAAGPSAQIPVIAGVEGPQGIETPATVHPMTVEFSQAADAFDRAAAFLEAEFLAP